jgi:hypothetical protein
MALNRLIGWRIPLLRGGGRRWKSSALTARGQEPGNPRAVDSPGQPRESQWLRRIDLRQNALIIAG